jgi:hypothetical protein
LLAVGIAFSTQAVDAASSGPSSGFSARIDVAKKVGAPVRHRSKGVLDGSDITGQGVVLVAAGAIHDDGDSDGVLDAGEAIDYHYTILNLGQSALSSLAATDSFGAVTCPQAALAPGAHMICTRNYVLVGADETAGAVGNLVVVVGQDASSRAVQASDAVLTQSLGGDAGVRVFKSPDVLTDTDFSNTVTENDVLRYTFVVKNSNAETLTLVGLTEPDPSRIDTPIVCNATSLAGNAFGANGSGTLGANDIALCSADYTVDAADMTAGEVANLVEVSADAPVAGNLVGTGASLVVIPLVEISLAKSLSGGGPEAVAGELLTYSLTFAASGTGRSFAVGCLQEWVPSNTVHEAGYDFTCVAAGAGSTCTNTMAVVVRDNGSVTLLYTVRVLYPAPAGATVIVNAVGG